MQFWKGLMIIMGIANKGKFILFCVAAFLLITMAGCGQSLKDRAGLEIVMHAVEDGNIEKTKELLGKGTSPNSQNEKTGISLLSIAASKGNAAMADLLLKSGANINITDKNGNTALMEAAKNGYGNVVKLLMSAGAKADAKNNDGMTAIALAEKNNKKDIASYIKSYGSNKNENTTVAKESNLPMWAVGPGQWVGGRNKLQVRLEIQAQEGPVIKAILIHSEGKISTANITEAFDDNGVLKFRYKDSWYNEGNGTLKIVDRQTMVLQTTESVRSEMANMRIMPGEYVLKKAS